PGLASTIGGASYTSPGAKAAPANSSVARGASWANAEEANRTKDATPHCHFMGGPPVVVRDHRARHSISNREQPCIPHKAHSFYRRPVELPSTETTDVGKAGDRENPK